MMEEKEETHPSFGMISFSRVESSEEVPLFGSSILHRSFIQLEIQNAILKRDLSRDWILPDKAIIIIDMSVTQFAEAITSLNTSGVPCTIKFMEHHRVQECPFVNKRVQFDEELEEHIKQINSKTNLYYTNIKNILSKNSIGKHDREEILKQLSLLQMQILSNMPFIKRQFTEQMDQTVLEAKNEVEAFVENKIKKLGLQGFENEIKRLVQLEDKRP